MKAIIVSIVLFGVSIFLTMYSKGNALGLVLSILMLLAILGTLAVAIWFKQSLKENFLKAVKIVFPLTAIIFLIGYFFTLLKVMV